MRCPPEMLMVAVTMMDTTMAWASAMPKNP